MKGFFMFLGAGGFTLLLIAGAWWLATHVNIKKDNFSNDAEVDKYSKLPDTGLGEPQRKFSETTRASDVINDHFKSKKE